MSIQSQIDSLIEACETGDLSSVQKILNAAADLDASRSTSQIIHARDDCALQRAARNGHEAVCRLLIEHDADIRADDLALQLAARNGHEAVCRLLIKHGADIHTRDDLALQLATKYGHETVCRLLIVHGANINADDDFALRLAAENGHEAVCRLLIEHGANIHAYDGYALRLAAVNEHEAICRLLLELDPLLARRIRSEYSEGVLRVFQAYGDHDAITEALMGFTDDENDYIASCFISRKSAF
jgi:ankyrin repeat protein